MEGGSLPSSPIRPAPSSPNRIESPAPFGPTWDFATGRPPWQRDSPKPAGNTFLSAKEKLFGEDVTLLDACELCSAFDREHGVSSTNFEYFLNTGEFLDPFGDVPHDFDDLERCLHKLSFALANNEEETLSNIKRLTTDVSFGDTEAGRRFRNVMLNFPVAVYGCVLHREAQGEHSAFADFDALGADALKALDLGNVGIDVDVAECVSFFNWSMKVIDTMRETICMPGLEFGALEAKLFPATIKPISMSSIALASSMSRPSTMASKFSTGSSRPGTMSRHKSVKDGHGSAGPSSPDDEHVHEYNQRRARSNYTKSSVLGKGFNFEEGPDAVSIAKQISAALRAQAGRVLDFFRELDADGNGTVKKSEFLQGMLGIGVDFSEEQLGNIFAECIESRLSNPGGPHLAVELITRGTPHQPALGLRAHYRYAPFELTALCLSQGISIKMGKLPSRSSRRFSPAGHLLLPRPRTLPQRRGPAQPTRDRLC